MRIIIGSGGTGGHLYPALALADYIKEIEPQSEILFVGTIDRLESKVVPQKGYNYHGLNVKGLVGNPLQKAKAVYLFLKSVVKAKKIIREFKPDVVVGFGGYPSASVVLAASKLNIPTLIHEQNSIIGLTNKILIKKVDKIICCYQKAYDQFPQAKTYLYGNPRASVIVDQEVGDVYDKYDLEKDKRIVTIVMGSLGSKTINDIVIKALPSFENKDYQILFVTGKNYYAEIKGLAHPANVKIVPYIDDMPSLLNSSDLVVSRAGASTIAEITAIGLPAILIPSPYVAANHQEYNAQELVDQKAATMILERQLTEQVLVQKLDAILNDSQLLAKMKHNAQKLGKPDALENIYKLVKETITK